MKIHQPKSDYYQAFYCEENVWQLIHRRIVPRSSTVIFVTNEWKQVVFAGQRAGDEDGIVIWDYHVVVLTEENEPRIWDWDARGTTPMTAREWFLASFAGFCARTPSGITYRPELAPYAPSFRLIPAERFEAEFASDRRHMKNEEGEWSQPIPVWPCIGTGHNLDRMMDVSDPEWGPVHDVNALFTRLSLE